MLPPSSSASDIAVGPQRLQRGTPTHSLKREDHDPTFISPPHLHLGIALEWDGSSTAVSMLIREEQEQ